LKEPLLILGSPHELSLHAAHQPLAGTEEATTWIGTAKTLQLAAGDVERLRREEGIDEKVVDAVTTDEGNGF
jgi:hypothetical protein